MAYLVLARKWRPQLFEDVIGQRPITQTLQNAISQKRVAHAFLFTGARGVGKTSTARILAKALNCEAGPQVNPCNHCTSCEEITQGRSVDVIEIDGASNRGIDEIRELRENARYTPAKNRYKIYIIDEVHMLTREAFNALLKTLEEPPPHILFVFATTEPHKIPATILSRCQRYDFKRIPLREMVGNLKRIVEEEKIHISQRGLLSIARESEGSMRDAQSLLDQVISYSGKDIRDEDIAEVLGLIDQKILQETIDAIAAKDAGRCMEMVEHVFNFGYDLQHFCRELLQYLRNLILIKVSQHPEGLMDLPEEDLGTFKRQAERFQFDQLNHLFSLLLRGEEEVTQSTFPRTMLEITLIRMTSLQPILPLDEILKKLERLDKAHPAAGPSEPGPPSPSGRPLGSKKLQKEGGEGSEPQQARGGRGAERTPEKKVQSSEWEGIPEPETAHPVAGLADPQRKKGDEEGEFQNIRGEVWKELVDFTRARNPVLGSFLALGNLVQLSEEKIEIGFEKNSFHYERMMEKGNRGQLESICHQFLRREANVVISSLDQGVRTQGRAGLGLEGTLRPDLKKPLAQGTEENKLIQEALRLFDGRIVEG